MINIVTENYPEGFIRYNPESESKPQEIVQSSSTSTVQDSSSSKSISGYDGAIEKKQDKVDSLNDRIDRIKDKISSGESTSQDRKNYVSYVELREQLKQEIKDIKELRSIMSSASTKSEYKDVSVSPVDKPKVEIADKGFITAQSPEGKSTLVSFEQGLSDKIFGIKNQDLYVEVASAPYQGNVKPSILTSPSTESKTNVELTNDGVAQIFPSDYGRTKQTLTTVQKEGYVPQGEVRPTSETAFGSVRPLESISKVTGVDFGSSNSAFVNQVASDLATKTPVVIVPVLVAEVGVGIVQSVGRTITPKGFVGGSEDTSFQVKEASGMDIVTTATIPLLSVPIVGSFIGSAITVYGVGSGVSKVASSKTSSELIYGIGETALFLPGKDSLKDVFSMREFKYADIVGGTEQYIKYGDNRIEKQFVSLDIGKNFVLNAEGNLGQTSLKTGTVTRSLGVKDYKLSQPEYNEFTVQGTQIKINDFITKPKVEIARDLGEPFILKAIGEGQANVKGEIQYGLTFNPKAILPKEPTFNEFTIEGYQKRLKEYGRPINENIFNEIAIKEGEFTNLANRPGQLTLKGKNALDSFKEPDPYMVKDVTESTQQIIVPIKILDITNEGAITQTEGIKLKPIPDVISQESTSIKSTKYNVDKERTVNVDTLFEGVGASQEKFSSLDISGRKKSYSEYNQELVLVQEEVYRGKKIDLTESITQKETVRFPIQKESSLKETVKVPIQKEVLDISVLNSEKSKSGLINVPFLSLKNVSVLSSVQVQSQQQFQIQTQEQRQQQIQQQIQEQKQTQVQEQILEQQQIQITEPVQKLVIEQVKIVEPVTSVVPKPRPIIEPPPKPPIESFRFPLLSREGSKKKRYELEIRRKGKFSVVRVGEDLGSISRQGVDILKDTLSASFRIKSEGSIVNVQTPIGFTRSKRESNTIVQPRSMRLGSMSERLEIQQAKRFRL